MSKGVDMEKLDRMDPELMSLRNRMNARSGWDKEPDRKGRMAKVRAGKRAKIAHEIDPEGKLPPDELAARIETRLALEKDRRDYEKALERHKQKVAGPSVGADGSAGETTTTQSARTGQEPQ